MKYILAILILVMAVSAQAVSLVCDPQAGVDYYVINGLPASIPGSHILPSTNPLYGFQLNIDTIPVGTYTLTAQACSEFWGCSALTSPLTFTRPASLVAPIGSKLIK